MNDTKLKAEGEIIFCGFFQPGKVSIVIDVENFDPLLQLIKPLGEWEIAVSPE